MFSVFLREYKSIVIVFFLYNILNLKFTSASAGLALGTGSS